MIASVAPILGDFECATGSAEGGASAPVVLATGRINATGVAVDAMSNVHWANYRTSSAPSGIAGAVMECAATGCGSGPRVVASNLNLPNAVALSATSLYVTTGDGSVLR